MQTQEFNTPEKPSELRTSTLRSNLSNVEETPMGELLLDFLC
jgi:hypothetical protein